MSAEVLRQAAALMRSRAEAAMAASADPLRPDGGGWVSMPHGSRRSCNTVQTRGEKYLCHYVPDGIGEHIAGMHPAVALAVADWLDRLYSFINSDEYDQDAELLNALDGVADAPPLSDWPEVQSALAVATAYLGADQ